MLTVCTSIDGELNRTETIPSDSVFPFIARTLAEVDVPSRVDFTFPSETFSAGYSVRQRGTYMDGGKTYPSRFITEEYCDIPDSYIPKAQERYLTCIHPESNNYKLYHFIPTPGGWTAEYGRIGAESGDRYGIRRLNDEMPNRMYDIRYWEKLSKGYVDQTEIFLARENNEADTKQAVKPADQTPDSILWELLQQYAKHYVDKELINSKITREQVRSAKMLYKAMLRCKTLEGFNRNLTKLLVLSPRRTDDVRRLLACDVSQFPVIADREERLLLAMEALIQHQPARSRKKKTVAPFSMRGISVFEATPEQRRIVAAHMDNSMRGRICRVWRVIPRRQQAAFDAYLRRERIGDVRQLWHGSRNENWLSIILNGLQLNPNAVITGKMFGNGIYFAPSSSKSLGYTSTRGSTWANGTSPLGYMGLYATAYGKPYETKTVQSFSQTSIKALGANCVHARAANVNLRNDEIIFYDEAAMVLNYIVEIK